MKHRKIRDELKYTLPTQGKIPLSVLFVVWCYVSDLVDRHIDFDRWEFCVVWAMCIILILPVLSIVPPFLDSFSIETSCSLICEWNVDI